jgi:hypothetical protein
MELLLKHGVGVKKRQATLIEVDESIFEAADGVTEASPPHTHEGDGLTF